MSERKSRRTFTKEFKSKMVQLHASGKNRTDIIREYELPSSTFDKWVKQANISGPVKEKDNVTSEQKELIQLRKQNKQLLMENDILKQATVIFGRKNK